MAGSISCKTWTTSGARPSAAAGSRWRWSSSAWTTTSDTSRQPQHEIVRAGRDAGLRQEHGLERARLGGAAHLDVRARRGHDRQREAALEIGRRELALAVLGAHRHDVADERRSRRVDQLAADAGA